MNINDNKNQSNALREHFKKIQNVSPIVGILGNITEGVYNFDDIKVKMPNEFNTSQNDTERKDFNHRTASINKINELLNKQDEDNTKTCSFKINSDNARKFDRFMNKERTDNGIDIDMTFDNDSPEARMNKMKLVFSQMKNHYLVKENEYLKAENERLKEELSVNNELIRTIVLSLITLS